MGGKPVGKAVTCSVASREATDAAWDNEGAVHQDSSLSGTGDLVDVQVRRGLAAHDRAARKNLHSAEGEDCDASMPFR